MKRMMAATLMAMLATLLVGEQANAQSRGRTGAPAMRRSSKPTTSPYLNLLNRNNNNNGGGGVGFNYFQRVRPEQEFRQADDQLRQGLDSVQKQVNTNRQLIEKQSNASQLTQSGHMTSFFSLGNYYPSRNP